MQGNVKVMMIKKRESGKARERRGLKREKRAKTRKDDKKRHKRQGNPHVPRRAWEIRGEGEERDVISEGVLVRGAVGRLNF